MMKRLFQFVIPMMMLLSAAAFAQSGGSGSGVRAVGTRAVNDCVKFASQTTIASAGAACGAGAGTVTSVGFTGGLISVGTPTSTPAFTVAGTSGGIPYFSAASTWASSGALTANGVVLGGGAGATPTVTSADSTTTHALFATAGAPAFRAIAAGDIPVAIPIANIGSAGLSGTSPITISAAGAIACATCVVASSPGVGIAHFAGSTQTVTSSLIVAADITSNTITGTQLAASLALVTPVIGVATGTSLAATSFLSTGTAPSCTAGTGGVLCEGEGTAPTAASAVSQLYSDSSFHDFAIQTNGGGTGIVQHTAPGKIRLTGQTASIGTATLCAATAGACDQPGHYRVDWSFYQGGTACSVVTAGSVQFKLTWTDGNSTNHAAIQLAMDNSASLIATANAFTFTTNNATAWATGSFNLDSNGSILQYATTYAACTTGTGTYALDINVTRMQ